MLVEHASTHAAPRPLPAALPAAPWSVRTHARVERAVGPVLSRLLQVTAGHWNLPRTPDPEGDLRA